MIIKFPKRPNRKIDPVVAVIVFSLAIVMLIAIIRGA